MMRMRRQPVVKGFRSAENARRRLLLTGPLENADEQSPAISSVSPFIRVPVDGRAAFRDGPPAPSSSALFTAEIVVVGVACTGKSAVCEYLLRHGLKATWFVIDPQQSLPATLTDRTQGLIVALSMRPERLIKERRQRLFGLGGNAPEISGETVRQELIDARRLCVAYGWPVIDVSHQSPSAAAARIVALWQRRPAQA